MEKNWSTNDIYREKLCAIAVSIKHGLRTTDCGLGIKYGLGRKRGLENMDCV